jgi:hypothetical protein
MRSPSRELRDRFARHSIVVAPSFHRESRLSGPRLVDFLVWRYAITGIPTEVCVLHRSSGNEFLSKSRNYLFHHLRWPLGESSMAQEAASSILPCRPSTPRRGGRAHFSVSILRRATTRIPGGAAARLGLWSRCLSLFGPLAKRCPPAATRRNVGETGAERGTPNATLGAEWLVNRSRFAPRAGEGGSPGPSSRASRPGGPRLPSLEPVG